jgi:glutaredoxin 3
MDIEIYSKTNCVFCDKAKMRLANENPKIHMLDKDFTRDDFFEKFPNARTFPQIIINGEKINNKETIANPESLQFFEKLPQLKL